MVLVIIFSVDARLAAADRRRARRLRQLAAGLRTICATSILPAVTMSVIPMGIIARTVRALVADILNQEFVEALRAKGLGERGVFRHVVKNAAPTALAVMGLQLGYLLGGSILVETVFAWPGTGFLLNAAIFQRDLPVLQGIDPGAGDVLRRPQPAGRRDADRARSAHPARLSADDRSDHRPPRPRRRHLAAEHRRAGVRVARLLEPVSAAGCRAIRSRSAPAVLILLIVLVAIFAPWLAPDRPYKGSMICAG